MKKIFCLLTSLLILNGCAESIALLGPGAIGSSVTSGGKIIQSTASSVLSYSIKQQTGKSPTEHALAYVKQNNPDNKKEKCVKFLESTDTEMCSALKNSIQKTKEKILIKSKIEDLISKSIQIRRR